MSKIDTAFVASFEGKLFEMFPDVVTTSTVSRKQLQDVMVMASIMRMMIMVFISVLLTYTPLILQQTDGDLQFFPMVTKQ